MYYRPILLYNVVENGDDADNADNDDNDVDGFCWWILVLLLLLICGGDADCGGVCGGVAFPSAALSPRFPFVQISSRLLKTSMSQKTCISISFQVTYLISAWFYVPRGCRVAGRRYSFVTCHGHSSSVPLIIWPAVE